LYKKALENEKFEVKTLKLVNLTENKVKEYSPCVNDITTAESVLLKEITEIINNDDINQYQDFDITDECYNCGYSYLCIN